MIFCRRPSNRNRKNRIATRTPNSSLTDNRASRHPTAKSMRKSPNGCRPVPRSVRPSVCRVRACARVCLCGERNHVPSLPQVKQYWLPEYQLIKGLFGDFQELNLLFAYSTLFVAAAPQLALFSFGWVCVVVCVCVCVYVCVCTCARAHEHAYACVRPSD